MVIRRSAHIDELIARLHSEQETAREAAIARLRITGAGAVRRLIDVIAAETTATQPRIAALRALEGLPDVRSIGPLVDLLRHPDAPTAAAAAAALTPLVSSADDARIVGGLTDVVLDERAAASVRAAALRALNELPLATRQPILDRLRTDASLRKRAAGGEDQTSPDGPSLLPLPDDPASLRRKLAASRGTLQVAVLHRLVDAIRMREAQEPDPIRRREWTTARGAVHQVLAERGSRVAVYDLREAIEGTPGPLPVEFLSAASTVGDETCVAALAGAYSRARTGAPGGDWWTDHLGAAVRAIVSRERLTRRHSVLRRIDKKWPGILEHLLERTPRPPRA